MQGNRSRAPSLTAVLQENAFLRCCVCSHRVKPSRGSESLGGDGGMSVVKNHGSWGPASDCKSNSAGIGLQNLYLNKPCPLRMPVTPTRGQGWYWLDSNKGAGAGPPAWVPQQTARSATLVSLHPSSRPGSYLTAGPVHVPLPGPLSPSSLHGRFLLIIEASTLCHLL